MSAKRVEAKVQIDQWREAAHLIAADPEDITLEQEQMAHHGVGTTLVALAAQRELPEGRLYEEALQEALSELRIAARIRAERTEHDI